MMRDLILVGGTVCAFLLAILSVELAPPATGAVAIIVDPFGAANAEDVIAAADGSLVRAGAWRWIAIGLKSKQSNFAPAPYAAGAWFVLSPVAAGGCENAGI